MTTGFAESVLLHEDNNQALLFFILFVIDINSTSLVNLDISLYLRCIAIFYFVAL